MRNFKYLHLHELFLKDHKQDLLGHRHLLICCNWEYWECKQCWDFESLGYYLLMGNYIQDFLDFWKYIRK